MEKKVDVQPQLKQVQDYVNNRRKLIGDNANIDELKQYLDENLAYSTSNDDHKTFSFGVELGDGSEQNHLHLSLTSPRLLRNINLVKEPGACFTFDCTYKIVKYNFPLAVLGVTDIRRKFHPIAYMFTSHEMVHDLIIN